ncbi:hypothetical protein N9V86_00905 [Opitutales bacterium]|nr:hypothetical protein [Opitutales bacterium]
MSSRRLAGAEFRWRSTSYLRVVAQALPRVLIEVLLQEDPEAGGANEPGFPAGQSGACWPTGLPPR